MSIKQWIARSFLLLALANPVHAAGPISSTFDASAEGWIGIPGEGSVAFFPSGGNPGGHIRVTDIGVGGPLGSGAIAPSKFLGDLSGFNNGTLSVDLATFAGGGPTFGTFGTVRISGAGDAALFDLIATAPPVGTWQTVSAPLTAAAWNKTPGQWMAILANVTEIAISTDAFDGSDTIGIDNFTIAEPSVPSADLAIAKINGGTTVVPGTTTTYTIVVSNSGPIAVTGAVVTDTLPEEITSASWTCVASAGSACGAASGTGSIATTVNLLVGGTATFTVVASIAPSATGALVNTASVAAPAGVADPTPGNNTAVDSDALTPQADLAIAKTNGRPTVVSGTTTTYTIVASNSGPSAVTGAVVTDTLPAAIRSASWTCVASAGSACGAASGTGSIATTVNLLVGGTATFTVVASIAPSATGTLVNTASVAAPAGVTEPTPGNNTATDTDTLNPNPAIPTLSWWGLLLLVTLLVGIACFMLRPLNFRL